MLLEENGYRVRTATNGKEAVQGFTSHSLDLVLLDYHLPEMSGGIAVVRLKDSKPEVPVALLSSDECLPSRDLEVSRLLHSEVRAHRQPFGENRLFAESTLSDPTFRRPESSGRRRARKRAPSWTRVGKTEWHLYEKGRHPKDAVNLEDMARET
jgi:CheY-like chemotaxis protein